MARSYDKERLIEKIMNIYDSEFSDRKKYEEIQKLVDDDIRTLDIKKTKLEELVASLQDESLLITYDVTTNITDEGHDGDGTLWIDLSISIEDVIEFAWWLKNTVENVNGSSKSITGQNDIENFMREYLEKHKVNFGNIGLRVTNYCVN